MKLPEKIYKIQNGKIVEYLVEPNECMPGWSVLLKPSNSSPGYYDIFPVTNEALLRSRFDSIKKAENYVGLENIVYYNSIEEAQEILDLEKRYRL